MQFTQGTPIFTSDGEKVGKVDRLVINPKTKEVTHIIVHKGLLLTTDKVVPVEMVASADEKSIVLHTLEESYEDLPDFMETEYLPVTDYDPDSPEPVSMTTPPLYWIPPAGMFGRMDAQGGWPFNIEVEPNIPEGTIPLKPGADVFDSNGEKVGSVEQVFTYAETGRLTHFVMSMAGFLNPEKRVIPIEWLSRLGENEVFLVVSRNVIADLPVFKE